MITYRIRAQDFTWEKKCKNSSKNVKIWVRILENLKVDLLIQIWIGKERILSGSDWQNKIKQKKRGSQKYHNFKMYRYKTIACQFFKVSKSKLEKAKSGFSADIFVKSSKCAANWIFHMTNVIWPKKNYFWLIILSHFGNET